MRDDDAMRTITSLSIGLLLLVSGAPAHAEYRRIELKVLGMDCATCAHGVRVAMQKLDGVATVELSLERAQAEVGLEPDNRLSLDQFRQVVKRNGFEPKQAAVTAIGTVRDAGGRLVFEVTGIATPLVVSLDKSSAGALQQLKSALSAKSTAVFEIAGTVEAPVAGKGAGLSNLYLFGTRCTNGDCEGEEAPEPGTLALLGAGLAGLALLRRRRRD